MTVRFGGLHWTVVGRLRPGAADLCPTTCAGQRRTGVGHEGTFPPTVKIVFGRPLHNSERPLVDSVPGEPKPEGGPPIEIDVRQSSEIAIARTARPARAPPRG